MPAVATTGRILSVLPRSSELSGRRAFKASSEAQALAANMDTVGVVVPVDRPLTHNRLERTLVAAWDPGATLLSPRRTSRTWRTTSSESHPAGCRSGRGHHLPGTGAARGLPEAAAGTCRPGRTEAAVIVPDGRCFAGSRTPEETFDLDSQTDYARATSDASAYMISGKLAFGCLETYLHLVPTSPYGGCGPEPTKSPGL